MKNTLDSVINVVNTNDYWFWKFLKQRKWKRISGHCFNGQKFSFISEHSIFTFSKLLFGLFKMPILQYPCLPQWSIFLRMSFGKWVSFRNQNRKNLDFWLHKSPKKLNFWPYSSKKDMLISRDFWWFFLLFRRLKRDFFIIVEIIYKFFHHLQSL